MKKSSTSSFILTLKLKTSRQNETELLKRFYIAWKVYNICIRHLIKQIHKLRADKTYQNLISKYHKYKDKEIKDKLKQIQELYGLTEYALQSFVKVQQHKYHKFIDSMTAQKIASQAWKAASSVLFGRGKHIHFAKLDQFLSLEGKNNQSGITFLNHKLIWKGLVIDTEISKKDFYARKAIQSRVKYVRIVRKAVGTRWQFYIQLILEGIPPVKHATGKGKCGIDIGTSTVAVVTDHECILQVLAQEALCKEKQIAALQRKMDRSRRANNPDYYRDDGTIKTGRKSWKYSKTYRKDQFRLKELFRKKSAIIKQSHEILANRILSQADEIYVEQMNFAGLKKKAKKSESPENKNKRRRRFGKSIQNRAPAMFLSILERKLSYQGKHLSKVNTTTFKASQYNHFNNTYTKKKLSQRWNHFIDPKSKRKKAYNVQRDLYSAFLIKNSRDDLKQVKRSSCKTGFHKFKKQHDKTINQLREEVKHGKKYPRSFGL